MTGDWRDPAWSLPAPGARRPPYRSARVRAAFAIAGLAISGLVAAGSALHYASFGSLLDGLIAGTRGLDDAREFDVLSNTLSLLDWALLIATGIAVLAWLSRAVANLAALGVGPGLVTPAWSIGWWFVPIANLLMVPRIVLDLGQRLDVARLSWFEIGVVAWWLTWLSSSTLIVVASVPAEPTPDDLLRSALVHETTDLMRLVAAVLLIALIRAIQGAAERRSAEPRTAGGAQVPPSA